MGGSYVGAVRRGSTSGPQGQHRVCSMAACHEQQRETVLLKSATYTSTRVHCRSLSCSQLRPPVGRSLGGVRHAHVSADRRVRDPSAESHTPGSWIRCGFRAARTRKKSLYRFRTNAFGTLQNPLQSLYRFDAAILRAPQFGSNCSELTFPSLRQHSCVSRPRSSRP